MTPPFLLVATLLASVAAAAGRPTVAVVGLHDPELELDDQRALAVDLARIIDEDGRFDGLEPDEVARALAGKEAQGAPFPITLPPWKDGWQEAAAYVVVTYNPRDLTGHDGGRAGVGSKARDRARLVIETDAG